MTVLSPEWTQTRLKYHASMKGRLGWQGLKSDEYLDDGPYVVSSAHFSDYQIRWERCPRVSPARYERDANIQLQLGDVLLMKDGAALGKLAQVRQMPGRACINSHLLLLRTLSPLDSQRFLFYLLDSKVFQEYMQVSGKGSTFLGSISGGHRELLGFAPFADDPTRNCRLSRSQDRRDRRADREEGATAHPPRREARRPDPPGPSPRASTPTCP